MVKSQMRGEDDYTIVMGVESFWNVVRVSMSGIDALFRAILGGVWIFGKDKVKWCVGGDWKEVRFLSE